MSAHHADKPCSVHSAQDVAMMLLSHLSCGAGSVPRTLHTARQLLLGST
jgi:hypothetical protein